ncbi:MAG: class I SAM-dependent methyltransferase [Acidobacteria bacterium]|nr:class I SAM-dependent methyltransferase [Acidobacteriota bacterium]
MARTVLPNETIPEGRGVLGPPDVHLLGRMHREREFFNQRVRPAEVEEAALRVPPHLEQELEPEVVSLTQMMAGKTVCDYGCGWGILSSYYAQCGAQVYCFDISEANIALTCRAARINGVAGRLWAQVMAGEWLAYPQEFFDFVIGNAVLHHVDIVRAAAELRRVLKPGGRAIFVEPLGENTLLEWTRRCPLRSAAHQHSPDEHSLRYAEIRQLERFFERVEVRETRLLRMLVRALEEFPFARAAGVSRNWLRRVSVRLGRADEWLLRRCPWLKPLCQYVVVTLEKRETRGAVR